MVGSQNADLPIEEDASAGPVKLSTLLLGDFKQL